MKERNSIMPSMFKFTIQILIARKRGGWVMTVVVVMVVVIKWPLREFVSGHMGNRRVDGL